MKQGRGCTWFVSFRVGALSSGVHRLLSFVISCAWGFLFDLAGLAFARVTLFGLFGVYRIVKVVFHEGFVAYECWALGEGVLVRKFPVYDVSLLVVALGCT